MDLLARKPHQYWCQESRRKQKTMRFVSHGKCWTTLTLLEGFKNNHMPLHLSQTLSVCPQTSHNVSLWDVSDDPFQWEIRDLVAVALSKFFYGCVPLIKTCKHHLGLYFWVVFITFTEVSCLENLNSPFVWDVYFILSTGKNVFFFFCICLFFDFGLFGVP